jgi:2-dehydro-3-deoxygalactonokinase
LTCRLNFIQRNHLNSNSVIRLKVVWTDNGGIMKYVITLDTGTTNTRTILWNENREMIARRKAEVGVRDTAIDGNNEKLKKAVAECISGLLTDAGIQYEDVKDIIASGMITSNVGIVEIPHCIAPVGIDDLAKAVREVFLPEICPLPIHFIPGVKNNVKDVNFDNVELMDIMRGEEVESCAIIEKLPEGQAAMLVLPGSHMKFISVDREHKITGCLTSISGELLSCITNNTIIADAVDHRFVDEDSYQPEIMLLGYENAKNQGLGRACFSGRILNQFVTKDSAKIANYILGAALQGDVEAVLHSHAINVSRDMHVIVSGKNPLRQAMVDIFKYEKCFARVDTFITAKDIPLSAIGSYIIADRKCALTET